MRRVTLKGADCGEPPDRGVPYCLHHGTGKPSRAGPPLPAGLHSHCGDLAMGIEGRGNRMGRVGSEGGLRAFHTLRVAHHEFAFLEEVCKGGQGVVRHESSPIGVVGGRQPVLGEHLTDCANHRYLRQPRRAVSNVSGVVPVPVAGIGAGTAQWIYQSNVASIEAMGACRGTAGGDGLSELPD